MVLRVLSLACLIGLVAWFTPASAQSPPLPLDLKITRPASDVPKEIAAFSGTWGGKWGDALDHILVVEQMEGRTAQIVYSWGVAPHWNINRPGFQRVTGTIGQDGLLRATLGNGAEVTYKLSPEEKTLLGQYILRGNATMGVFKRQP